jgi:hypothetical protein
VQLGSSSLGKRVAVCLFTFRISICSLAVLNDNYKINNPHLIEFLSFYPFAFYFQSKSICPTFAASEACRHKMNF